MVIDDQKKWLASAKANQDFIDLRTYSACGISVLDPEGRHHHLPADATDQEIGVALLDVLESSRLLSVAELVALQSRVSESYEEWVAETMNTHGYRNRRAMFKAMKSCAIEKCVAHITLIPLRHEKTEGWTRVEIGSHVVISSDRSASEIGAALRLALDRCR